MGILVFIGEAHLWFHTNNCHCMRVHTSSFHHIYLCHTKWMCSGKWLLQVYVCVPNGNGLFYWLERIKNEVEKNMNKDYVQWKHIEFTHEKEIIPMLIWFVWSVRIGWKYFVLWLHLSSKWQVVFFLCLSINNNSINYSPFLVDRLMQLWKVYRLGDSGGFNPEIPPPVRTVEFATFFWI